MKEFFHSKVEIITGAVLGSSSIPLGKVFGFIQAGDLHSIGLAFLTGSVGGLGAWIVKHIAEKIKKNLK